MLFVCVPIVALSSYDCRRGSFLDIPPVGNLQIGMCWLEEPYVCVCVYGGYGLDIGVWA